LTWKNKVRRPLNNYAKRYGKHVSNKQRRWISLKKQQFDQQKYCYSTAMLRQNNKEEFKETA